MKAEAALTNARIHAFKNFNRMHNKQLDRMVTRNVFILIFFTAVRFTSSIQIIIGAGVELKDIIKNPGISEISFPSFEAE